jgi:putative redox protein
MDRSACQLPSDRHGCEHVALLYAWHMSKHVSVRWNGELDFEAVDQDGASVEMSPKPDKYGPAALVLAALAGCTGMDAASIMSKKRVDVASYRVEVDGEQREAHPRSFTSIVVEHVVDGKGIDDKALARALELSARKYCVVGATLATGDTSINHRLRITDELGERTCDCLTIGPKGAGLSHYADT